MPGWEVYFLCGLVGVLVGALVSIVAIRRHLGEMAERHRLELERQHHALRTSFLQLLRGQVVEHRAKAQVRLLNAIFSHLSNMCLPVYAEGQTLCGDWEARADDLDGGEAKTQLESLRERVTGALAGFTRLIDQNRNQDEIYREFQDGAAEETRLLRSISAVMQELERVDAPRDRSARASLDARLRALTSAVADFGQWIKLSMEKATHMQESLTLTESSAEMDLVV